ncbi:MAG: histidinol-phosphatase [Chloroflexi bacterium]|nr:histidinol-phosphatase [Chloroflexota bacterium]
MLTVELHSHTIASKDCLMKPEAIIATCRRKGIDRLAVTDHNTTGMAFKMAELAPDLIVPGEEIFTTRGELLAYFVTEEVPAGLSPRETIDRLRAQGAAISVSHPFDRWRKGGWNPDDLAEIALLVDAIEVFNARCILPSFNAGAFAFARQWAKLGTVGSDAHSHWELGRAVLRTADFHDGPSFVAALRDAQPITRASPPWIHLTSRYAVWVKRSRRVTT